MPTCFSLTAGECNENAYVASNAFVCSVHAYALKVNQCGNEILCNLCY